MKKRKNMMLVEINIFGCQREFLHQVDLLSPSRTGVTEAEYWAQRWLDEKKQKIETEGCTEKLRSRVRNDICVFEKFMLQ